VARSALRTLHHVPNNYWHAGQAVPDLLCNVARDLGHCNSNHRHMSTPPAL
jgi:hypothetical protein